MSCAFAQKPKVQSKNLKMNSVKAVEYLNKELKLDSKQKAIVMNAYAEYASNMMKATAKQKEKQTLSNTEKTAMAAKRDLNKHALRFAAKRDEMVNNCLKKKQSKLYGNLVRQINPFTLEHKPFKK